MINTTKPRGRNRREDPRKATKKLLQEAAMRGSDLWAEYLKLKGVEPLSHTANRLSDAVLGHGLVSPLS